MSGKRKETMNSNRWGNVARESKIWAGAAVLGYGAYSVGERYGLGVAILFMAPLWLGGKIYVLLSSWRDQWETQNGLRPNDDLSKM